MHASRNGQAAVKAPLWRVPLELRERLNKCFSKLTDPPRRGALPRNTGTHRNGGLFAERPCNSTSQTYSVGVSVSSQPVPPTSRATDSLEV